MEKKREERQGWQWEGSRKLKAIRSDLMTQWEKTREAISAAESNQNTAPAEKGGDDRLASGVGLLSLGAMGGSTYMLSEGDSEAGMALFVVAIILAFMSYALSKASNATDEVTPLKTKLAEIEDKMFSQLAIADPSKFMNDRLAKQFKDNPTDEAARLPNLFAEYQRQKNSPPVDTVVSLEGTSPAPR